MKVEETWHKLGQELKNHRLINSNSATASCPAHQDKIPSLSLKLKKDIILFKCHAGCTFSEITKALGMSSSDFKFKKIIIKFYNKWMEAFEKRDFDEVMQYCNPDYTF